MSNIVKFKDFQIKKVLYETRKKEVESLLKSISIKPQLLELKPLLDFLFQVYHYEHATEECFWWDLSWVSEFCNKDSPYYFKMTVFSAGLQEAMQQQPVAESLTENVLTIELQLTETVGGCYQNMLKYGYTNPNDTSLTEEKARELIENIKREFGLFVGDILLQPEMERVYDGRLICKQNPLKEFYRKLLFNPSLVDYPYKWEIVDNVVYVYYELLHSYNQVRLSFNYRDSAAHFYDYDGFQDGKFFGYDN